MFIMIIIIISEVSIIFLTGSVYIM